MYIFKIANFNYNIRMGFWLIIWSFSIPIYFALINIYYKIPNAL